MPFSLGGIVKLANSNTIANMAENIKNTIGIRDCKLKKKKRLAEGAENKQKILINV